MPLQELALNSVSMIMGEAEIAGFQLRSVIHGLRLTSLAIDNLTISGFSDLLAPAPPASHLTGLRSTHSNLGMWQSQTHYVFGAHDNRTVF